MRWLLVILFLAFTFNGAFAQTRADRLFDRGLLFRLSPHYMEIFTVIFPIAKVGDDNNSCKDK